MKKILHLSLLIILSTTLFTFCKKEKDKDEDDKLEKLDGDFITNLVSNEGVRKIPGTPPAPTGAGAPVISAYSKEATGIVTFGARTVFNVQGEIAGAYVLVEGASSYLNIPIDFEGGGFTGGSQPKGTLGSSVGKLDGSEDDLEFILEMLGLVTPGTFCYEICLYDEDNNVSNIERICVTINTFGGNSDLAGKWVPEKYEEYENGVLVDLDIINYDSVRSDINCNGQTITYKKRFELDIKASGDYFEALDNILVSGTPCPFPNDIFYNGVSNTTNLGKWSYDRTTKEIVFVEFANYDNFGTPVQTGGPYNSGELYIQGILEFNGSNRFVISFIEVSYTEKYYFKKL